MGLSNYIPSSRLSQAGVVANTADRPATPYEGQVLYQRDTNQLLVYDGSAWVMIADTDQPPGLQLVGSFAASGTNRALVCDNVFTSDFQNYRVVGKFRASANTNTGFFQMLNTSGAVINTNYFATAYGQDYAGGTAGFTTTQWVGEAQPIGWIPNSTIQYCSFSFDIYGPRIAGDATHWAGQHSGLSSSLSWLGGQILGARTAAAEERGIRFDNGSASNLTGVVRVYGYRD